MPSKEEFIELNDNSCEKLIDLVVYKGDELVEDENLLRWEIVSVEEELIEIDLFFERPLHVSQQDDPEKLIVQVKLH